MPYLDPAAGAAREARTNDGAPSAGTSEIQTLTIGGTPTGGTFKLSYKGQITAAIAWTATDASLVSRIDAALGALTTIGGAPNITTAAGTISSGIGTITLTFAGNLAKLAVPLILVDTNALTGSSPTLAIAETTPGVTATHRGAPKGAKLVDTTNGVEYMNTGTVYAPVWSATDVASVSQEMIDLAAAIPTAAVADLGAVTSAAVAGSIPAGGTGAAAGGWDTSGHRDTAITTITEMITTINAMRTDIASLRTKQNDLLAKLRTAGIVTP